MSIVENHDLNWLYIDINSYFASVEQDNKPYLRGKPTIVVPMNTDSTCAIAASYEAKAFGIKTGTKVYEAKKLCKDLKIVEANHKLYTQYHHRIMEVVENYLPIEKVLSIDEAACKLSGTQKNPKKALSIAQSMKDGICEEIGGSIKCSIGISVNRYLAKTASNITKPNGLEILHLKDLPQRISHFKLSDLTGIGRQVNKRLEANNINTIEALWNIPRKEMRNIWGGVVGERFWYMLHGYTVSDIETKKSSIGHSKVLAPQERDQEIAKEILCNLAKKAAFRCRDKELYTELIDINISLETGKKRKSKKKIPPSCDDITIISAVRELWQKEIKPNDRIKQIGVTLNNLTKTDETTEDLFAEIENTSANSHKKNEKVSKLMDEIRKKYRNHEIISVGVDKIKQKEQSKVAFARIPEEEEYF